MPIDRFRPILLDVWREACRHIEIDESTTTIAGLLAQHMPVGQILVRRIDREHRSLTMVAAEPATLAGARLEARQSFSTAEFNRTIQWLKSTGSIRKGSRLSGIATSIAPADIPFDWMVAPLLLQGEPIGLTIFIAKANREFDDGHQQLLEALCEPFAAALDNDRRLEETAALREAAEADRGALLRRLGRTEMSDIVVGEDSGLKQVMQRVNLVAPADAPVLILGETGTGKELIARAIHNHSPRSTGPFIRVNCGAIPSELIDSQLFGHERGSFTGADQSRPGWFERADGGTLFLDEIGELPLEAQVRFLRVLQDGFVERVGGHQAIHVDVRIVAATHRDLAAMVSQAKFREDLWYRLAVFPILLPPLRDRRADIAALARHFAERAAHRFGLMTAAPTDADIALLHNYDWPGNIRELGAVIDRAAILGQGHSLAIGKALGLSESPTTPRQSTVAEPVVSTIPNSATIVSLDEAMKLHIERALAMTFGQVEGRRGAAAILKINPHTLRARMRKMRIDWQRFRDAE